MSLSAVDWCLMPLLRRIPAKAGANCKIASQQLGQTKTGEKQVKLFGKCATLTVFQVAKLAKFYGGKSGCLNGTWTKNLDRVKLG